MANWRRGFFRLWVLLTTLWVIAIGAGMFNGVTDPYIAETQFTFNKDDELEVVPAYGDAALKMRADEAAGYFTRVGFKSDAARMIYMAPNAFRVTIRGKEFEALVSNDRINNPNPEGLAVALMEFINKTAWT